VCSVVALDYRTDRAARYLERFVEEVVGESMSDLDLDPVKTREMANTARGHVNTIRGLIPLAAGNRAAPTLEQAEIGIVVDAIAEALDRVVSYHAQRLQDFSELTDKAVDEFLGLDADRASDIGKLEPK